MTTFSVSQVPAVCQVSKKKVTGPVVQELIPHAVSTYEMVTAIVGDEERPHRSWTLEKTRKVDMRM